LSAEEELAMFRSILVPVDFTDRSGEAVDLATRLVAPDGGRVTLLHVVQTVPGLDLAGDPDFYRRLESAASKKMRALGERLQTAGIEWKAAIVIGNRYDEIVTAADDDVDLLLVSSHRVDLSSPETGAGTMSYRLAVTAPCPVLLLK
jgi:universal stress protein A